jgi:hypothetical protein
MKVLETIYEDAMVAAFLRAEIDSPRWKRKILDRLKQDGRSRTVVDKPNLLDNAENAYRARLLAFRGYRDRCIFSGFPDKVQWYSISMTREDLEAARVINDAAWPEFSGGTRLAGDVSRNLTMGRIRHEVLSDIKATADRFKQGYAFPELILVGGELEKSLVILEGHVRTIAILASEVDRSVGTIVGISSNMRSWSFY